MGDPSPDLVAEVAQAREPLISLVARVERDLAEMRGDVRDSRRAQQETREAVIAMQLSMDRLASDRDDLRAVVATHTAEIRDLRESRAASEGMWRLLAAGLTVVAALPGLGALLGMLLKGG